MYIIYILHNSSYFMIVLLLEPLEVTFGAPAARPVRPAQAESYGQAHKHKLVIQINMEDFLCDKWRNDVHNAQKQRNKMK